MLGFCIRADRKYASIYKKLVLTYCVVYVFVDSFVSMDIYTSRILGAVSIALQLGRYLLCKLYYYL